MSTPEPSPAAEPATKKVCGACEALDQSAKLGPEAIAAKLDARGLWSLSADGTRITRSIVALNFKEAFAFMVR